MSTVDLHADHGRSFEDNRFVYPVLSRRSGGISVGVNLNPDKVCNFDCIYCQVDRTRQSETRFVGLEPLLTELREVLNLVTSGDLYANERFRSTPVRLRRLNDIAFSGDGEPTTYKNFDTILSQCATVKRDLRLEEVKMVLITNASMFHRPHVRRGLQVLDRNNGQIWAKLDAGTEAYFQRVERTAIPFQQVLDNLTAAARARPIVIQSLFMKIDERPPPTTEILAFCDRLNEIVADGGTIDLVQIYTVARQPAESTVRPLDDATVDTIVDLVTRQTKLSAEPFYGNLTWESPNDAD